MADIHPYPFLRHVRGAPTSYIRHSQNGRVVHEGDAQVERPVQPRLPLVVLDPGPSAAPEPPRAEPDLGDRNLRPTQNPRLHDRFSKGAGSASTRNAATRSPIEGSSSNVP